MSANFGLNNIVTSGNLGVNTYSPLYQLDVAGTGNINLLKINDQYMLPTGVGSVGDSLVYAGSNQVAWSGVSVSLSDQLDGNLDLNGYDIVGTGNITIDGDVEANQFIGNLRGAIYFTASAGEALTKGDAVYISGISGNTTVVSKADANDSSKMPAFGIAAETVNNNANVNIITFGSLYNIDTDTPDWDEGDELYVSNTAGVLTKTAPTGESSQIQKIAKVTRRDNSAGSIKVMGAGRSNATPNLNEGRLFVGNSSNQAVADGTIHVDISNSRVGIGTPSPQAKLDVNGTVEFDDLVRWEYPDKALDTSTSTLGYMRLYDEAGAYCGLGVSTSSFNVGTSGAINLRFATDAVERIIVGFNGNTVINELGHPVNFRVEGDADENLLLVKGAVGADKVGVGTSLLNGKFNVYHSTTDNSFQYGIHNSANHYTTTGGTNYVFGNYTDVRKHVASGVTDTGYVMGHECNALLSDEGSLASAFGLRTYAGINNQSDNGNLTAAYGVQSRVINYSQGTGNINTARGIDVYINGDLNSPGNGGITNAYGVYIQSILNSTNTYGLYQVGSSDKNYFAGDVGIGTASPETKLDVRSTIQAKAAGVKIQSVDSSVVVKQQAYSAGNVGILGTESNHNLEFRANNIGYMYLTTSGNVGIGTASPLSKLHVRDTTDSDCQITVDNGTARAKLQTLSDICYAGTITDHNFVLRTNNTTRITLSNSSDQGLVLVNPLYNDQDFEVRGVSEDNLIYVDAGANNVGIGIGVPTQRLHVYEAGNAQVLVDDGTVKTKVQSLAGQSKGIVGTNSNHDLEFRTNNNGKMIIKAGGDVGIGTPSPSYKLDVNGTFSANSINVNDQFTFPTTDGSADQVLVTNGSGVLTWQDQSGGGTGSVAAWGSYNGSTNVRGQEYNISSITDNGGVGNHTVNLSVTMSGTDYCVIANEYHQTSWTFGTSTSVAAKSTTSFRLITGGTNGTTPNQFDSIYVAYAVFGN